MDDRDEQARQTAPQKPQTGEPPAQPETNWGDDERAEGVEDGRAERPTDLPDAFLRARPWRAAKSLLKLRAQVDARAPRRVRGSDGTVGDAGHQSRRSDHNPWVVDGVTGIVTAMDITNDPAHGCTSDALARSLVRSRDPRIKYVISNRRIANSSPQGGHSAWAWRPYGGASPHDHHVHVSVKSDKALYDDESDWTFDLI
jgi:hypothetical protein